MLKKISGNIPAHIKLLMKLYVISLILFFFIRVFFYQYNKPSHLHDVAIIEKLMAFRMGLEFDTAVFCWVAFLPALAWTVAYTFKKNSLYNFGYYSFLVLLIIYFFIDIADIPYFKQFGTHLNRNAFLWNENPNFALGVVFGSFSYWGFFLFFFAIVYILLIYSKKIVSVFKIQLQKQIHAKWYSKIFTFLLLATTVTIGARGRTSDRSGIHEGLSIVSQNNYINQIAINPNFTFWKSIFFNNNKTRYKVPTTIIQDIAFTRNYLDINKPYEENINRVENDSNKTTSKYNFVIVVMESMSVFKMGYYNGKKLTPNLDRLNKESVFFDNFFTSGIHTFNGLFSTTTGYPSIYSEKSMKSYVKESFNGLGPLMAEQGYESYFYTTHDPHFDNMEGFFKLNKFNHFISQYDFDGSLAESSLGVPDHILLDKLIEITNNRKDNRPFLSVLMTASDHGPWKIPTSINYKPNGENPQENCTLYADWAIGRFMAQAKKLPWYNNTVFIFLGDHGLSMGHTYEMPLSYNHVPLIIHQPKLFKADTISSPCYQPDIPATVMGIIGSKYTNTTFGLNVLKQTHPFVVFSADDKIGCIDNQGYYYYKTLANDETYLRKYKNLDPINYKTQFKQKVDSMEKNMMHIYNTANYFIRKNNFLYE
jgi:phosphoglycerol transferase MdoB-like AlkP superfamily enzyme